MSAKVKLRIGALAAGMSCLLLGNVFAEQQNEPASQVKSAQYQGNLPDRAGQNRETQTSRAGFYGRTGQRYTTNYRGGQTAEKGVERYLASCLSVNNKAEIEIAKFAEQQAHNAQVKQFAQQLVKDHHRLQQQIQKLPSLNVAMTQNGTSQVGAQSETTRETSEATRNESASSTANELYSRSNANRTVAGGAMGGSALLRLAGIDRQITQRCSQMLKEDLQQKSGTAFDQAFLGALIGDHMHALAALEVISQNAQGQLQQVAQQARPTIQKHLDRAKQLMKELSSNENASQAERTSRSTQR